jgi:hypothetical protein
MVLTSRLLFSGCLFFGGPGMGLLWNILHIFSIIVIYSFYFIRYNFLLGLRKKVTDRHYFCTQFTRLT